MLTDQKVIYTIFIVLYFISFDSYSQGNDESTSNIILAPFITTKGSLKHLSFGRRMSNSQVSFGPSLGKTHIRNKNLLGIHAEYLLYPNRSVNVFNFYFLLQMQWNHFKDRAFELTTNIYQGTIGYGFDFVVSRRVLIFQNMSLGLLLESKDSSISLNRKNEIFGAGTIQLGLRYEL